MVFGDTQFLSAISFNLTYLNDITDYYERKYNHHKQDRTGYKEMKGSKTHVLIQT